MHTFMHVRTRMYTHRGACTHVHTHGRYTMMYWYLEYLVGLQINLKRSSLQHAQQLVASDRH